ncbi:MAG: 50S ribosomal protein L3 [Planctomycetota bacterium]
MGVELLGTKLGMTRIYAEDGSVVPVTVIALGPCVVTQIKTAENDGYSAVQLGVGEIKPRNSSMALIGHDHKAGVGPKRRHGEFRIEASEEGSYELGQELTVSALEGVTFVDVVGTSKGKGFQGGMKRHGFKGQLASHGVERKHRSPGSIGGHALNAGKSGRLKKGKKMAGHMGHERVTCRSLELVKIDPERHLALVKGPVPGPNKGEVRVRPAVRLNRSKSKRAEG